MLKFYDIRNMETKDFPEKLIKVPQRMLNIAMAKIYDISIVKGK